MEPSTLVLSASALALLKWVTPASSFLVGVIANLGVQHSPPPFNENDYQHLTQGRSVGMTR